MERFSRSENRSFLVLIGGCSRTGKSTLAKELEKEFKQINVNSLIIKIDNWLLGLDERSGKETVSERYNYSEIVESIRKIMKGEKIFPPIYNPKTRKVIRENLSQFFHMKEGICIVEGVISLDIPDLRNLSDFKIYTEVSDEIRKARLMKFYNQYKKCSLIESKDIIEAREAEEVPYVKETKIFADFIFHSES
ncbi:MAG: uridine kinase family protein [Candidatus Hodarchaeales archaeon]|jgi:uridine kinase